MCMGMRAPVERSATAPAVEGWERLLEQVGMKDIFADDADVLESGSAAEVDVSTSVSKQWDRPGLDRIRTADLEQLLKNAFEGEGDAASDSNAAEDQTDGNLSHFVAQMDAIVKNVDEAEERQAESNSDSSSTDASPRSNPSLHSLRTNSPYASFAVTDLKSLQMGGSPQMASQPANAAAAAAVQMYPTPPQQVSPIHHAASLGAFQTQYFSAASLQQLPQAAMQTATSSYLLAGALPQPAMHTATSSQLLAGVQLPQAAMQTATSSYLLAGALPPQPQVPATAPQPLARAPAAANVSMLSVTSVVEEAAEAPEQKVQKKRRRGHRGRGGKGKKVAEDGGAVATTVEDEPFRA